MVSQNTAAGAEKSAPKLACIKCGAGLDQITIDAQIIVTFRLNSNGEIDRPKQGLDERDLVTKASEEGPDYKNGFCEVCGTYMGMEYDQDGRVIAFNDKPAEWK